MKTPLYFTILLGLLALPSSSMGQIRQFPYEAAVQAEGLVARGGPGSAYYETDPLKLNQHVAVFRHDPGGWYMIAPPRGSYSLVKKSAIQQEVRSQGLVTEGPVAVHVGSQINDENDIEQRRLVRGDRVEILKEVTLKENGEMVEYYKISPPRGEYRWVKGEYLLPVNQQVLKQFDNDPYSVPSNAKRAKVVPIAESEIKPKPTQTASVSQKPISPVSHTQNTPAVEAPVTNGQAVVNTVSQKRGTDKELAVLNALDGYFEKMVTQDVSTWKFDDLLHDYRKLQKQASTPRLEHEIESRIAATTKYVAIKKDYDELTQLTSGTEQRDAQLVSMQQQVFTSYNDEGFQTPVMQGEGWQSETTPIPDPAMQADGPVLVAPPVNEHNPYFDQPTPLPEFSQPTRPMAGQPQSTTQAYPPQAYPQPGNPQTAHQPGMGQNGFGQQTPNNPLGLTGAGIVQRSPRLLPGRPQHVLITPNGQVLAHLMARPGVNLEMYVGRPLGLYGTRRFAPLLGGDIIEVTGVTAIELKPTTAQRAPQR